MRSEREVPKEIDQLCETTLRLSRYRYKTSVSRTGIPQAHVSLIHLTEGELIMATHNITINEGGKPTPQQINVEPEDMVRFEVVGSQDVLLCLDSQVFEKELIASGLGAFVQK